MKVHAILLAVVISAAAAVQPGRAQDRADAGRGAHIWAATCNRCHNARSPLERNDGDWAVIVNHMRTMANLTRSQARDVSAFLQTANGERDESVGASSTRSLRSFLYARSDSAAVHSEKLPERDTNAIRRLLSPAHPLNHDQHDE